VVNIKEDIRYIFIHSLPEYKRPLGGPGNTLDSAEGGPKGIGWERVDSTQQAQDENQCGLL
jgi:hypothetical protein